MTLRLDFPEYFEHEEVWNQLENGIQAAREVLDNLDPETKGNVTNLGKILSGIHLRLVVPPEAELLVQNRESLLKDPWIKHATDLEVAEFSLSRASRALHLYPLLTPVVFESKIPSRAQPHLDEVTRTFVLGLFPATIALCRATLEQVLKERLVDAKVYTEPQLRREQPTAGTLIHKAKQNGILSVSFGNAQRIVKAGDTVMHRAVPDKKIQKQSAIDSITDLITVMLEALGQVDPKTEG